MAHASLSFYKHGVALRDRNGERRIPWDLGRQEDRKKGAMTIDEMEKGGAVRVGGGSQWRVEKDFSCHVHWGGSQGGSRSRWSSPRFVRLQRL